MPSQIRPNRLEVSDRFPMLGFTIRTEGKRYEVALASDAALFRPDARAKRSRTNFYSSRAAGLQPVDRGEAVYVLPPEVLARFVGRDKLYYALATYANGAAAGADIALVPSEASPYINLKALSARSLKRIQVLPSRQRAATRYGNGSATELDWAGDAAVPGVQPAVVPPPAAGKPNGKPAGNETVSTPSTDSVQAAALDYNDGFGPLPSPRPSPSAKRRTKTAMAQSGQSFSINWDDVELVPQPNAFTCWATAAAMVIGWRDRVSLTPETVAGICGRTAKTGLDLNDIRDFASEIGLETEGPQSYSIDGLRAVLESKGPLWVSVQLPGSGHAIVVTGMYSDGAPDGSDTFVRISDPWDRVVGAPGAPGDYLPTHSSGSRYILSWADFVREYELLASTGADGVTVSVQILHAPGTDGRQPSRSGAVGYAMDAVGSDLIASRSSRSPADEPLAAMAERLGVSEIVSDLLVRGVADREIRELLDKVSRCAQPAAPPAVFPAVSATALSVSPIPLGKAKPVRLPEARSASTLEEIAIKGAIGLLDSATSGIFSAMRTLANDKNLSVAVGPSADVGFGVGLAGGVGIIFAPAGEIGTYGDFAFRAGLVDSLSAGVKVTVVRGGIEAFNEVGFAVGGAFVEGVAVTVQVLLGTDRLFRGISLEIGIGLSVEPFEVFVAVEGIVAQQIAHSQALALSAGNGQRRYRGTKYPTSLALTARVPLEQAKPVTLPAAREATTTERFAIDAIAAGIGALAGPLGAVFPIVRAAAASQRASVAIGPTAGAGFVLGAGVGVGVIFAPNDLVGVYGTLSDRVGFIDSLAAGVQLTIVRGGINSFNEIGFAVGGAFVEGVEVTIQVLLDATREFRGVSFELGVGISAEPFELFAAIEASVATEVTAQAVALSYAGSGGQLPAAPAARVGARALEIGVVAIASTIAGAVMEKVINHDGNITWQLEQLRGLKHPGDTAPSPAAAFRDAETIRLDQWPYTEALDGDQSSAWFSIDWQFNGQSLGNVQLSNVGTNGALLRGLRVDAKIMDDNIVYARDGQKCAALKVRFNYQFTRAIGPDAIAITDLHLYGDGTFDQSSRWEQN